jgi:hypothetical protein
MARPGEQLPSLRLGRREIERLTAALLISILVHLGAWGGYMAEKKFGWWSKLMRPFQRHLQLVPKPPVVEKKIDPQIFLDVADPSAEPPKEAKYYSSQNSKAANPEADKESNQPKLTGKQTFVTRTEDVPKQVVTKPTPPAPAPQKPAEAKPAQEKPATSLMPGGLEKAKPENTAKPDEQPAKPERPRTLREAMAQQRSSQLPGQAMQQSGGVREHRLKSSLDALGTSFGGYDRAVIEAVTQRWYDLLDSQQFASDRTGKVTVTFTMHPDGTITEVKISGNTVGDLLGYVCQAAIEQAAPFGKWPSDMKLKFGVAREITFTFYYY